MWIRMYLATIMIGKIYIAYWVTILIKFSSLRIFFVSCPQLGMRSICVWDKHTI